MAEKDFTCNIKINGREELNEIIKEADKLVQRLEKAQKLIDSLSGKKELEINDVEEILADVMENVSVEENQGIGGRKEELNIPHEILKLIFDKHPKGVSVGEITYILNETRILLDDISIV